MVIIYRDVSSIGGNGRFSCADIKINILQCLETDAELFGYCYGVAGTVGEVLTPILSDHETHQTYDVAKRLGESLQLINILRDVGEDFENERIYFSKQRLKQYEVDIAEVYQNGVNNHYIDLWEILCSYHEKDFRDVMDQIKVF